MPTPLMFDMFNQLNAKGFYIINSSKLYDEGFVFLPHSTVKLSQSLRLNPFINEIISGFDVALLDNATDTIHLYIGLMFREGSPNVSKFIEANKCQFMIKNFRVEKVESTQEYGGCDCNDE